MRMTPCRLSLLIPDSETACWRRWRKSDPVKRSGRVTMRSSDDCPFQRRLWRFSEKTLSPEKDHPEKGRYDPRESRRTRRTFEGKFTRLLQRPGEEKFPYLLPLLPD